MGGIGQQSFNRAASSFHQQIGERPAVELPEYIQLFGDGEDDVSVITGQQLRRHAVQPFGSLAALALRARTVSAGVVLDTADVPAGATFQMSAESTGATIDDA